MAFNVLYRSKACNDVKPANDSRALCYSATAYLLT